MCLIEAWVNCSLSNTANGQRVGSCDQVAWGKTVVFCAIGSKRIVRLQRG